MLNVETNKFCFSNFFHDLFTVIWVGGLFSLALVVMPAMRQQLGQGPEMKKVVTGIQSRLSKFVYLSMVGLMITGMLKARSSDVFLGLFHFGNPYSVVMSLKHIFVVLMVVITLTRSLFVNKNPNPKNQKISAIMLVGNLFIGILVLLLSGFSVAFGNM